MRTTATQREIKTKLSFPNRTTPEEFKKMDEIEKNVRQQLLVRITGKNHITDENRNFFALPLKMGGLDLLISTDFSRKNEWSQAICDPLENSAPEIAETEQTLINGNIKTERQNITLSKKGLSYRKLLIRNKTDNKSSVTEKMHRIG